MHWRKDPSSCADAFLERCSQPDQWLHFINVETDPERGSYLSRVTQKVGGRVRPKPGVSPDLCLRALSRASSYFTVVSLLAPRAAEAHHWALLHACQVAAETGQIWQWFPGSGVRGNTHSGQKRGLWR